MWSHFSSEYAVIETSGLDAVGNTVHIGDRIIFVGSNGYLIKGKVTNICKIFYSEIQTSFGEFYKWYYKICTDNNRITEKDHKGVVKILKENENPQN